MYRAVYRDSEGRAYSAPVEQRGETWMMLTSDDGWKPITSVFRDDQAGNLFFSHYRNDVPPTAKADTRLHVEGQGFKAIQNAVAKHRSQIEAEQSRARTQALSAMNPVDQRTVQQARQINNQFADRLKPKREVIPPTQLTEEQVQKLVPLAEEHRWHRPKKED